MTKKTIVKFLSIFILSTFVFALSTESFAQPKPKKKARKLAQTADKLFNQGKYNEAIIKYAEALSISPEFPQARFFKGSSHYRQKQYDLAVNELSLALQQGSDPVKVYPLRMESYAAQGNFQAAMDDAQKVVKFNPDDAYYNGFLGKMYLLNKEFRTGIPYLEQAAKGGTRDPNVFYYLAVGYNGLGNYEKQEISADMALKGGTPFSGNAWYLYADALQKNRKYSESVQAFKNAINSYKTMIDTNRAAADTEEYMYQSYVNLADVYRNLNKFEEAIDTAKAGLSLRPNDKDLHISLPWYYSLAGNREFALTAGKRAVEIAPDQFMSYTNLCRAYNEEGEYLYKKEDKSANKFFDQAVVTCKKALAIEPNDGETNYYLGRAYYFLDNESLSQSYYKKSVGGLIRFTQVNPDYSDGFYLLGNAYFATADIVNAIKAYENCLKIAPRFAIVRYNLGYVYIQNGNRAAAREQYELLKDLDGDLAKRLLKIIK